MLEIDKYKSKGSLSTGLANSGGVFRNYFRSWNADMHFSSHSNVLLPFEELEERQTSIKGFKDEIVECGYSFGKSLFVSLVL